MAIGTPTICATAVGQGAGSSIAITTNVTVPSSSRIFLPPGWAASTARTVNSVSGGPSGWASDKAAGGTGAAEEGAALLSVDAPSGLASGTTITVTLAGAVLAGVIGAFYCTGIASSSYLDGSGASTFRATANGSYTSGSATLGNANDLIAVVAYSDNFGSTASAPGAGYTELIDFHSAQDLHLAVNYELIGASGSYSGTGTWSDDPASDIVLLAAYNAAGVGSSILSPVTMFGASYAAHRAASY